MRAIYFVILVSIIYGTPNLFGQQNVGIGTTDPTEALEVVGNIALNGTIVNESYQIPTLLNGWVNYDNTYTHAGYYKDKEGRVHLKGLIKNGTTTFGTILFTLPSGYRPTTSGRHMFPALTNPSESGRIDVDVNGNVLFIEGSNMWLSLSGISFRAD